MRSAILLLLCSAGAGSAQLTAVKIADQNSPVAGATTDFGSTISIRNNRVLYGVHTGPFGTGPTSIWEYSGGTSSLLVSAGEIVPGTGLPLGRIINCGTTGTTTLIASGGSGNHNGFATLNGGTLQPIFDSFSMVPGTILSFGVRSTPTLFQSGALFYGNASDGSNLGIYHATAGGITRLIDLTQSVSGLGTFSTSSPSNAIQTVMSDGDAFAFHIRFGWASPPGLYVRSNDQITAAANSTTIVPGTASGFTSLFDASESFHGGTLSFVGTNSQRGGVYARRNQTLMAIADTTTNIPGFGTLFNGYDFFATAASADAVAFLNRQIPTTNTRPDALWIANADGSNLRLLLKEGDTFDGKTVSTMFITPDALENDSLVFTVAFTDGSFGHYLATVPEPGLLGLLLLGVAAYISRS